MQVISRVLCRTTFKNPIHRASLHSQSVRGMQVTSKNDKQHNYNICKQLCEEAQAKSLMAAEPLNGPTMQKYQDLARQHRLWLSLGGFQEQGPPLPHGGDLPAERQAQSTSSSSAAQSSDDTSQDLAAAGAPSQPNPALTRRLYNAHVVLSDTGALVAHYRKIHLFDVDVPNGPVLLESRTTLPGDKLVVCDSPVGRLALTVCYDLRFPEMWQRLAFDMGAQAVAVPSAFTKTTGEAHWELLCRARAVECQAFVIAAAQAGKHSEKRESFGHSLIVDPWGAVLTKLDGSETGVAVADLDLERLEAVRQKMPIVHHRQKGHRAYLT
ncbi:carbon-nitrogen hydrolase [Dunaliella salina]|uniref:Carbon-nitrogen hydrolase n=1 Tax=Dunaliella salina TaxID=3046 RepID=A0ABQ7G2B7_DUNSA|nr:carbon-nitrogen hydrolase [Dunaliella salina]|eukprot:KAF5828740.1 carbon-nitrogen hydrolase [Dunaliella salina]